MIAAALAALVLTLGPPPVPAPTPPPDAPKCVTIGGSPIPHWQYLPCGWRYEGPEGQGVWIPPAQ